MEENILPFNKNFAIAGELRVNRMGYGAMRITGEGIWGPPADRAEALRVLKRTVELGINFIDTADSYGPHVSEELIAEALHPYPSGLVIGTKGGLLRTGPGEWPINAHPNHLARALEGSLKRLKLEQIDLYQLHRVDSQVPVEKTFEFLQKAQQEGKIKHIGLSEVGVETIKRAETFFKVVSVQNMYNVGYRRWEDVLQYTAQKDIAFIPWYPLSAGNIPGLEILNRIAAKHQASVHQVALSWLLHHSPNILLIPGTSRVKHLEENYQALNVRLTAEDMQQLDTIAAP